MPRVHVVKKARKDYPSQGIKKGDQYYWWKFNFSKVIHKSKTRPQRSQLTRSDFLSSLYDLQDNWNWEANEELESQRDDLVSQITELKEQCEESLQNMPEHLQESSDSGQTLQERIEALDQWISDLEGINCDWETLVPDNFSDLDEDEQEEEKQAAFEAIIEELQGVECSL